MLYSYRNLVVWQKAQELALHIFEALRQAALEPLTLELVRPLLAAATAISVHIAEGYGRFNVETDPRHLLLARDAAATTDSWLQLLLRAQVLGSTDLDRLSAECNHIIALLAAKLKSLERPPSHTPDSFQIL